MLSGLDPLLTGELLAGLDRLGHGDLLVVADANFPAYTAGAPVVELPGTSAPAVVRAIRSVTPVDAYDGPAVALMTAESAETPAVQRELLDAADAPADRVESRERFDFYALAATASLVVRTGETRPYGNLALRKGVVMIGAAA